MGRKRAAVVTGVSPELDIVVCFRRPRAQRVGSERLGGGSRKLYLKGGRAARAGIAPGPVADVGGGIFWRGGLGAIGD